MAKKKKQGPNIEASLGLAAVGGGLGYAVGDFVHKRGLAEHTTSQNAARATRSGLESQLDVLRSQARSKNFLAQTFTIFK